MTRGAVQEVVVAERVEVVDKRGHVRVVVADDGIHLLGRSGQERASLTLTDSGPQLVMRQGRQSVVVLGVMDETPDAERTGVLLVLADRHGRPRAGWFVGDDGSVEAINQEDCGCHGTD